ncbi:MAG: hypothetical protein HOK54_02695 [Alphaproteobacteria bacterium]|jgi:TolB-like protein|nr:hypothetical protein [Alphaproteobacteria bacterium]
MNLNLKNLKCGALASGIVMILAGCGPQFTGHSGVGSDTPRSQDADLVSHSYQAAENIVTSAHRQIDREKPILVASLVNVSNLRQSSNFGRIVSEQLTSRLAQMGYETRELKLRSSFLVLSGTGELVLSRRLKDISQKQSAQAIITGVYAVAKKNVYVTLRLISATDGRVIFAYDYVLPLGPDMIALLAPVDPAGY